jgi:hypothetical protein
MGESSFMIQNYGNQVAIIKTRSKGFKIVRVWGVVN